MRMHHLDAPVHAGGERPRVTGGRAGCMVWVPSQEGR